MLSSRQQHCLQGIGVRLWRKRNAADASPLRAEPLAPAAAAEMAATGSQASELNIPPSSLADPAPALDMASPEPAARQAFEIPQLDNWDAIIGTIQQCTACELSQNCTQKVPGVGDRKANLLIVGEGPGHDEDIRGEPFVGRSGQLLDRMLAAIGIAREQVYITNIVKCRPPNNRDPKPDEAKQCRVYLDAQIKLIAPKVILSVGRVSAHNLLGSNLPVGKLIQQIHQLPGTEIPVKVTYHPAYLLRSPAAKATAWQDLKLLHRMLQ
ncbi:uracil-DNA glycosylase [Gammaproteobacteria bacterium]|nr:uracil-DNA glycosylase [Gammaproteobacteria bacterium]